MAFSGSSEVGSGVGLGRPRKNSPAASQGGGATHARLQCTGVQRELLTSLGRIVLEAMRFRGALCMLSTQEARSAC